MRSPIPSRVVSFVSLGLAACLAPVSLGSPDRSRTVGQGNGIWAGGRVSLVATEQVELAASARVGGLALGELEGDIETDESATARYGSVGFSGSLGTGSVIRPGLAVRYNRYQVRTKGVDANRS